MVALDPTTRAAARRGAPGAGVVARPGAGGACAGAAGVRRPTAAATRPVRAGAREIDRTTRRDAARIRGGSGGGDPAHHGEQVVGTLN